MRDKSFCCGCRTNSVLSTIQDTSSRDVLARNTAPMVCPNKTIQKGTIQVSCLVFQWDMDFLRVDIFVLFINF